MGMVNVYWPEELIAAVERQAERVGESRSAYIANAVKMLLKEKEEKSKRLIAHARYIQVLRRDLNYARKTLLKAKQRRHISAFLPEELKRDAKVLAAELKTTLLALVTVAVWRRMAKEAAIEAKAD